MSTINTSNPMQQLAQQIVQRFDSNQDGQLTTDEFSSFLTSFMGTLGGGTSAIGQSVAAATRGNGGSGPMEGFDFRKMGDPSVQTVKYKFARVAQNWDLKGVRDMPSAESQLNAMKGELQAAGVTVLEIRNDKINVLDDAGNPHWVDVIRGAGGYDPAWQWGPV